MCINGSKEYYNHVIVFILDLFCINNQYNGESYSYSNNLQTVKQTSL